MRLIKLMRLTSIFAVLITVWVLNRASGCSKSGKRMIAEEHQEDTQKKKKIKEDELNKVVIEKDDEDEPEESEDEKRERRKFVIKYDEYNREYAEIPMFKTKSGVFEVPIRINGLELDFVFDTGASEIAISELEYKLLVKKNKIKESDIKGKAIYKDASGNTSEATKIVLRRVELGNKVLNDVEALVVPNSRAPLLLGQSALSRFGKVEIDYDTKVIRLF